MLKSFHVVRSAGPRVLFMVGAGVTVAVLLWMNQLGMKVGLHGLSTIFFVLFADQDYFGAVCLLLILLCALFLSQHIPAGCVLQWAGVHPTIIAVISALLLAAGTLVIYHNHPLAMDEYAAYFQSRVFAAGRLHGSFPPRLMDWLVPPGFQDYFLNVSPTTGSVAETYWPGFALLLAPFTWAGVPWLCNPIISALTLLVIHRLALVLFGDREAAGLALLLTVASPVIFANGISYYSMPAHLLANSLYALLLVRPTPLRAFVAGAVGSVALSLHNPVPHALFAVPWLIWIAIHKDGARLLTAQFAGYLPLCVLLGLGWFIFSTHLLGGGGAVQAIAPVTAAGQLHAMIDIFSLPSPTVLLARTIGVAKIWIWAVPGLLILAGVGAVRCRQDTICRLLVASALLTIFGYFFVPVDQGHGWGYRYFHSAWVALPLLATAAVFHPLGIRGGPHDSRHGPPHTFEDSDTKSYVTTCILLSLIFGLGLRAWQMQAFIARDLNQTPHYSGAERQVMIIDDTHSFYGADLVQNDPWLRGEVIRMYSHGAAKDAKMMAECCPDLHRVYADRYGTVWSQASAPRAVPRNSTTQGLNDATTK